MLLAVLAAAVVTVLALGASGAWADADHCKAETGYKVCAPAGGSGGGGDGSGSAVGSAVVQGSNIGTSNEDLPITGTSPVRTLVIGAAFIVVGAAAVAGSLQARRRANPSY